MFITSNCSLFFNKTLFTSTFLSNYFSFFILFLQGFNFCFQCVYFIMKFYYLIELCIHPIIHHSQFTSHRRSSVALAKGDFSRWTKWSPFSISRRGESSFAQIFHPYIFSPNSSQILISFTRRRTVHQSSFPAVKFSSFCLLHFTFYIMKPPSKHELLNYLF